MYWKLLVALAAGMAAAPAGPPGEPGSCVLQKGTAVRRFELSELDGFSGEVLTTESNGNIYFVSICRPIPQELYDPRKMAGALKLTPNGHWIELGRIDQSNIVVNENTIVLTYDGGDVDKNPKATCKGLKWNTYLTFICDPFAIKDTLTLLDEDADQPEICQVWFEIRSTKTCNRHPYMPLGVLIKDINIEKKLIRKEIEKKIKENNTNKIPNKFKAYHNEQSNLNSNNDSFINQTKKNTSNHNHPQNNEFELEPFISIYPKHIAENNFFNIKKQNENENKYKNEEINKSSSSSIKLKYHLPENKISVHNDKEVNFSKNIKPLENKNKTNQNNTENSNLENERLNNKNSTSNIEDNFTNNAINRNKNKNLINPLDNNLEKDSSKSDNIKNNIIKSNNSSSASMDSNANNQSLSENKLPKDNEILSVNNTINDSNQNHSNVYNHSTVNANDTIGITVKPSNNDLSTTMSNYYSNQSETVNTESTSTPVNQSTTGKDSDVNQINNANTNTENSISSEKESKINPQSSHSTPQDSDTNLQNSSENTTVSNISKNDSNKIDSNDSSTLSSNNTVAITVKPSYNNQSKSSSNYYPNQSNDSNDNSITPSTILVDQSTTIKNTNANQMNNTNEITKNTKSFEPKTNKNSLSSDKTSQNSDSNSQNSDQTSQNLDSNLQSSDPASQNSDSNSQNSSKNQNVSNDKNNNSLTTDNSQSNQSQDNFNLSTLFSKLFPNGFSFSNPILYGVIGSFSAIYALVVTAINRFYYKKTGTDQIPHLNSLKYIFDIFKFLISKSLCGLIGSSGEVNATNENTPLLNPKNVANDNNEPQKKDSSDNDSNSGSNNKGGYGSISAEKQSPTSETNGEKKSRIKNKDSNNSEPSFLGEAENLLKQELNLEGSSVKEVSSNSIGLLIKKKIVPAVVNFFKKKGIDFEQIENEEKKIAQNVTKNVEPYLSESKKKKLADIEKGLEKALHTAEELESTTSGVTVKEKNEVEKLQTTEKKDTTGEKKESISKPVNNKLNTESIKTSAMTDKKIPTDLKSFEKEKSVKVKNGSKTVKTEPTKSVQKGKNTLSNIDVGKTNERSGIQSGSESVLVTPPPTKKNEAKLKLFGSSAEKNKNEKEQTNGSSKTSGNLVEEGNGDDSVEVIEEIIYVDAADGEDEEEIIEEITETTTSQDPDSFNSESVPSTMVTVRKTVRKISSSSEPGEVKTTEETVVTNNGRENEKKSFGLKLGIGKSGVKMSVGERKLGIGMSGVKFGKRDDRKDAGGQPDAVSLELDGSGLSLNSDKRKMSKSTDVLSVGEGSATQPDPKKSKKSKSNFTMFKRSVSQPVESELREAKDVYPSESSTLPRKVSRGSAGLLIFGKSRSKSASFSDTEDTTTVTDVGVVSDFIDHERRASVVSKTGSPANGSSASTPAGEEVDSSPGSLSVKSDKKSSATASGTKSGNAELSKGKMIGDQLQSIKKAVKKKSDADKRTDKHAEKHASKTLKKK